MPKDFDILTNTDLYVHNIARPFLDQNQECVACKYGLAMRKQTE